jgi:recombinational DNA repair protein (RecF pathway)
MSETDPHIHVDRKVIETGADYRNVVTSLLGVVPDTPSVVTAGCGQQVPHAMTATRPESVTCLPCREHAHREYTRLAAQFEHLGAMPGSNLVPADQMARAVAHLRDLATRFGG